MKPVRTAWMKTVYRGTTPDVGDLWVHRPNPGEVWAVFELEDDELEVLKAGGRVVLKVLTEPLPPVALAVCSEEDTHPVGPHHYKVIPELEERDGG